MKPRTDPWALNPDKLLAHDAKKNAPAARAAWDEILAIAFSKSRRKALISRLTSESPGALYRGDDATKVRAAVAAVYDEIRKELAELGIAEDKMLLNLLFYDVIRDPEWKRARRVKKSNPPPKPSR